MSSSTKLKKSELKVPTGLRRPVKATPSTPAATAGGASSSTPEGAKDAGEVKAARVVKPLSQKKLQKYQAEHENRGVCYLSRIPPYLKPSALREMLSGLGTDVLRVYLAAQQRGHTPVPSLVGSKHADAGVRAAVAGQNCSCMERAGCHPADGKHIDVHASGRAAAGCRWLE